MARQADSDLEAALQAMKQAARQRLMQRWRRRIENFPFWHRWTAILLRRLRYVAWPARAGARALQGRINARLVLRRG